MFAKIVDNQLIEMQSSGIDDNGCQYVVDTEHAFEYARDNGYKEVIVTECPSDDKEYIQEYIEVDDNIIVNWK